MKLHHYCAIGGMSLLMGTAAADESTPLGEIYKCASIADDMQRLACFDAAVAVTKTAEDQGEFA